MRCASATPAGVQADEHDVVGAVVALDDLVRDAGQRAAEIGGIEDVRAEDGIGSGNAGAGQRRDRGSRARLVHRLAAATSPAPP